MFVKVVIRIVSTGKPNWSRRSSTTSTSIKFSKSLLDHLDETKLRYEELASHLEKPGLSDLELRNIGKQYSELGHLVSLVEKRKSVEKQLEELITLELDEKKKKKGPDDEMVQLIVIEKEERTAVFEEIEQQIISHLVPKDRDDAKDVVLEVRAGTGGDEASIFAGELFKMYQKFCDLKGWKWEQMSLAKTEVGGFKEAQATVRGDLVHQYLKYESGVHRVQRIPSNDTKIQTSAASVVVMPEAEEVDVELRPQDLKIDLFRSQGAGGQNVNKTESAVRMTHIPTGCVVSMQDERSQQQNRARALQYLRARVYDLERKKRMAARAELRSLAQGTGDRSDKIRTYNFPQDRVTDHRIGITVQGVDRVLNGLTLGTILEDLVRQDEKQQLEAFFVDLESSKTKSTNTGR